LLLLHICHVYLVFFYQDSCWSRKSFKELCSFSKCSKKGSLIIELRNPAISIFAYIDIPNLVPCQVLRAEQTTRSPSLGAEYAYFIPVGRTESYPVSPEFRDVEGSILPFYDIEWMIKTCKSPPEGTH
jgi:hypothetical protein